MATWNNALLTNDGHALQAKLLSTDTLQITRVVAGKDRDSNDELINKTGISNIAQQLVVEQLAYDTHGNAIIKVACYNKDLATGYIARQIGIYATDPEKGEILYAVVQESGDGDEIPSNTEMPYGYYNTWTFSLTFGAASSVSVTIDTQHAITREEADRQYSSKTETAAAVEALQNEQEKMNTAISNKVPKEDGKGLSAEDFTTEYKKKLDGIAAGATKTTVDSSLNETSTNPVQNKAVAAALKGKVDAVSGKGLSTEDFTTTYKKKLDGIAEGATKVVVDEAISETGTNPVQGKAIHAALKGKVDAVSGKVLSSNDFTNNYKNKLDGIDANANNYTHPETHPMSMIEGLEDAIAGAKELFVVNATATTGAVPTFDKTGEEVIAAINEGKVVILSLVFNSVKHTGLLTAAAKLGNYYFLQYCTPPLSSDLEYVYVSQTNYGDSSVESIVLPIYSGEGNYAIKFGYNTTALGNYSHTGGYKTTAAGDGAIADGYSSYESSSELPDLTNDTDPATVIEAYDYSFMLAFGKGAHATGIDTLAVGEGAHAEGDSTMAVADGTHAEGYKTEARGVNSHAEGEFTEALGEDSHAEGYFTSANGDYSHAANYYNIANQYQTVVGRLSKDTTAPTGETDTTGSLFIVGNGTNQGSRANAFRVAADGKVYGAGAYNSSGADVAELWEWEDGNPNGEDRRGLLVTLNGEKIRPANAEDDFILGFVSATPCLVGNAPDDWHGKYLKDVFGQPMTEQVEVPEQIKERKKTYVDEEKGEEKTEIITKVIPAHTETRYVLNPDYDPEQTYIPREERKEWSYVGFHGQIVAIDDGTCEVNGYCAPFKDGILTASATATDIRVMKRIDDTHIKVYVR